MSIYKNVILDYGDITPVTNDDSGILKSDIVDSSTLTKTEYTILSDNDLFLFIFERDETLIESEKPIIELNIIRPAIVESGTLWQI